MSLCADKSKGILTEQRFLKMTTAMEDEQERNRERAQEITGLLREEDSREDDARQFVEEIRRYSAITELDEMILNRLIDCIVIGAVEIVDGEKVQKVRIVYNFGVSQKIEQKMACPKRDEQKVRHDGSKCGILRVWKKQYAAGKERVMSYSNDDNTFQR